MLRMPCGKDEKKHMATAKVNTMMKFLPPGKPMIDSWPMFHCDV